MTANRIYLFFLFILITQISTAQQPEKLDTTISIFWNHDLKVRVQIRNPDEPDIRKNNAALSIYSVKQGSHHILFQDSLFAYTILFRMMDMDGDGIKDLLVYNTNNGAENLSYHLYLVDQKEGRLTRVKGFERIFNPYFDQGHCNIIGIESFEKKMNLGWYKVDKKGNLGLILIK